MKYFKNRQNDIYAFDDNIPDEKIDKDLIIITKTEADSIKEQEQDRLTYEYEKSLSYSDKRMVDYAPIVEQLDKLYHDINNGTLDKTGKFYQHILDFRR